ncbi:MAG TPA: pirin family protein [Steroidobacteraceae bacterium]|nr:pirin family protein [Steroidobacteraceae bacterium]
MLTVRPAAKRGHAQHGWLDSWHSFSFADYYDPQHVHFGPLRVINEDRVQANQGFGTHSHADMEIISYVLEGELQHKDSMGTGSVIRPGDVQRMSAGRGVQHSEFNPSPTEAVHFLQIWILPDARGIAPEYEQRTIPDSEKRGRLRLIASPAGDHASLRIHQNARMLSGLFSGAEQAQHELAAGRLGYVQLARGAASVNGVSLRAGDGALLREESSVSITEGIDAEVLVFDLPGD